MNASLVSGHILGSVVGTVVWEVAIHLPTDQPGGELVTAGIVGPSLFAALSLGLIALGERAKTTGGAAPSPRRVRQVRRAVAESTRRKELSR